MALDNKVPPVEALYQCVFPALDVALKVTWPASQRLAGVVEVKLGVLVTVAITAVLAELHPLLAAST